MSIEQYRSHQGQSASEGAKPAHIAIIMDGNGRWAQMRNYSRTKGHKEGVKRAWDVVKLCIEHQIPNLTLFAFGKENWKRPSQEVRNLFRIFYLLLKREIHRLESYGVKLQVIGDRSGLVKEINNAISEAETKTKHNTKLTLNVAINYSSKWDILQSIQALIKNTPSQTSLEVLESQFVNGLGFHQVVEPDLFIRTSGVQRLSNFMLWELAYTELYFTQALWPDFDKHEFEKALNFFQKTERRFGLISEQVNKCSSTAS